MLSIFTLPFDIKTYPYDWLIVCIISSNIVALIALFITYIEFKINPPLPKFKIHSTWKYLTEFTSIRFNIVCWTLFLDIILIIQYMLYVLAMATHLILFE